MYSTLIVLCLSLGSITIISGQRQMIDAQILDEGGDQQCPSAEARERTRNELVS